jgi:hypothetical protein
MGIIPSINVTDIVDLIKKGSTLEAQERIMKLREAALDLQAENLQLRERVETMERELRLRAEVEWDGVAYWRKKDDGTKDGPFCQRCMDVDSKLVRMHETEGNQSLFWHCVACRSSFRRRERRYRQ